MHNFLRIEKGVLKQCWMPKSLLLLDDCTSIGECAFLGCDGLEKITIVEGLTSIGECAFLGCSSLKSITIPDSVTSIGDGAFRGCTNLTLIRLPARFNSPSERKRIGLTSNLRLCQRHVDE